MHLQQSSFNVVVVKTQNPAKIKHHTAHTILPAACEVQETRAQRWQCWKPILLGPGSLLSTQLPQYTDKALHILQP